KAVIEYILDFSFNFLFEFQTLIFLEYSALTNY
ncbi:unnamed protein product, partial [marine sediment metagenome]